MKIITSSIILAALSTYAFADEAGINKRQENQNKRIEQGVESGSLNKREAARLNKGQQRIEKMEEKASADGKVTKRESYRINKAQSVQSKRIVRQKHDRQGSRRR